MVKGKIKPTYRIGISGRNVTFSGKYAINHGPNNLPYEKRKRIYNNSTKEFDSRKDAIKFRDKLIREKRKKGFKINYIYMAD